ncbi:cation channel sperm-associated 3 isoform X1 [Labeo rohita]|uniref:Cation channel sperm-associated 3 isoform X1 n=1 Tax=Labeo rohita TaxID=84645 RepID=A0A498L9C3_LABRO|nr:cation channel sperm-associated 3 isoform X1 [Labeo rohita]
MEFLLKTSVDPWGYWRSPVNVLSVSVLLLATVCMSLKASLEIVTGTRILLVFRLRTYTDVEQEYTAGIWRGLKKASLIYFLIFVIVMVFATAGHTFFGDPNAGDPENWGDLGTALFTLFRLLVVHQDLDKGGVSYSSVFIIGFIITCYFTLLIIAKSVFITECRSAFAKAAESKKRVHEEEIKKKVEEVLDRAKQDKITSSSFIGTFMQQLNKREQTKLESWRLINEMMAVLKEELEDKLNEEALAEERDVKKSLKKFCLCLHLCTRCTLISYAAA